MGLFERKKVIQQPGAWRRRPLGLPKDFEKRQAAKQRGGFFSRFMNPAKPKPEEAPLEQFWSNKKYLTRPELREKLRKAPAKVSGFPKPFSAEEKIAMEEKEFPEEKFGLYIEPKEYEKWKHQQKKSAGKSIGQKLESEKKVKFWEGLTKKPKD